MQDDIAYADPAYRRKLFLAYLVSALLVAGLAWIFVPLFLDLVKYGRPKRILWVSELLGIGFLVAFALPSLYLIQTGRAILREGRTPHSKMRSIYDTPILRGKKALNRGRALIALGSLCLAAIILGSGATHFIFYKFKTDPLFFVRSR